MITGLWRRRGACLERRTPVNACSFTEDRNMGTKTDQMWMCTVPGWMCGGRGEEGGGTPPNPSVCWPRREVIAGWFRSELKSAFSFSCMRSFHALAFSRCNRFCYLAGVDGLKGGMRLSLMWRAEREHESNSCVMDTRRKRKCSGPLLRSGDGTMFILQTQIKAVHLKLWL